MGMFTCGISAACDPIPMGIPVPMGARIPDCRSPLVEQGSVSAPHSTQCSLSSWFSWVSLYSNVHQYNKALIRTPSLNYTLFQHITENDFRRAAGRLYLQFSYGQVPRFELIYHLLHAGFVAYKLPSLMTWDGATYFKQRISQVRVQFSYIGCMRSIHHSAV